MSNYLIATFYHFTPIEDVAELRLNLRENCEIRALKGTLLIAPEGINGTLAGSKESMLGFLTDVRADPRFAELRHKESWASEPPFIRLKVRLKREIVTLGVKDLDLSKGVGKHVKAEDWNALISQPEVVLLDTRNAYETAIGRFEGARDPGTESFGDFPKWLKQQPDITPDTPIAMYCTGGIRCEKASAYLLREGFENVYQLDGGILKYLESIPSSESRWRGECYVFDRRVTVDHNLRAGSYAMCRACGQPLDAQALSSPHYVAGVSCEFCIETTSEEQRSRFAERQKQVELAAQREQSHFARQSTANLDSEDS